MIKGILGEANIKNIFLVFCLFLLPSVTQAEECVINKDHTAFTGDCKKIYKFTLFVIGSTINQNQPNIKENLSSNIKRQHDMINAEKMFYSARVNELVPHGLWLDLLDDKNTLGFITSCNDTKVDITTFPTELRNKMKHYYVDVTSGLYKHEWSKHGSCFTGYTQETYFSKVFELMDEYQLQSKFISLNAGKTIPYDFLQKYLVRGSQAIELICSYDPVSDMQHLSQIWITLDSEFNELPLTDATRDRNIPRLHVCDKQDIYIPKIPTYKNVSSQIKSLPNLPINVGFDIDETVLDMTLLFDKGKKKFPNLDNNYWLFVNSSDAEYSSVKLSTKLLVEQHQKRGDAIYFLTARPYTANEKITQFLADIFNMNPEEVNLIFTHNKDKSKWISDTKIKIYYGDADTDITSTMNAGANPIRILRNANTQSKSKYRPGYYGETVIINSNI